MTELPTTPFPELRPLDEKQRLPTLAELLRRTPEIPAHPEVGPKEALPTGEALPVPPLGALPEKPAVTFPGTPPDGAPAATVPSPPAGTAGDGAGGFSLPAVEDIVEDSAGERAGTDEELVEALRPILEASLDRALHGTDTGLHTYLEPMLRSTVRRAIAEQLQGAGQFREIGMMDRLAWRLRALFTSRTYDEIVFERTRRYQIEEVYLVRRKDRGLISYAVHDPALHASPRRIQPYLRRLTSRLREQDGEPEPSFDLPEHRAGLVQGGRHSLLVAVIRGRSNAHVRADLEFIHRQIEEQFGSRLETRSDAFIHVLQPLLEGCLLIQSPAPPR